MPRPTRFQRSLALLLAAVFLATLPGCGASPPAAIPQAQNPSAPTAQPAPATPRPTSTPAPAIVATATHADSPATPVENVKIAAEKNAQAPNFKLPDTTGAEIALGDLRGQVVLLNFWTTW
jgi:predicted small lipoprotein YifL